MCEKFGPETLILTNSPIDEIKALNERAAQMIHAYRNRTIGYVAGGGGRYGKLIPPWESDMK